MISRDVSHGQFSTRNSILYNLAFHRPNTGWAAGSNFSTKNKLEMFSKDLNMLRSKFEADQTRENEFLGFYYPFAYA